MNTIASLDFDHLYSAIIRPYFSSIKDERRSNSSHKLEDILSSSFAMFSLKSPSLLGFEQRTPQESKNISSVYALGSIPSDSQARLVLDKVCTNDLHDIFPKLFSAIKSTGLAANYHFLDRLLVSVDGTEFFKSSKISCPHCLEKSLKSGTIHCSHALLSGVLVHPEHQEVLPLANEPIARQDGQTKNDCERNAAKRLLARLREQYLDESLLLVEDALYANVPHIEEVLEAEMDYIIGVKPKGNKTLFERFEIGKENENVHTYQTTDQQGNKYIYHYINEIRLNNSHELKTNLVVYEYIPKKGKAQKGSWITSLEMTQGNVGQIVKAAKARWKIENETFNTLKNQGYQLDHNFGHGKQYLANNFALLMMMAFLVDQIQQAGSKVFQKARAGLITKIKLWEALKAVFKLIEVKSMTQVWTIVIQMYQTE